MRVKYLIDYGSRCNSMPFDILQAIAKKLILKKTESQLKFYDEATIKSISKYSLYTKIKDKFLKYALKLFQQKYLKIHYYQQIVVKS